MSSVPRLNCTSNFIANYKLSVPSLKRMSLLKLATQYFNDTISSVRGAIIFLPSEFQAWVSFRDVVAKNISKLALPKRLSDEIWDMLKLIYLQATEWEELIEVDFFQLYGIVSRYKQMFTMHGKINGPKMFRFYLQRICATINYACFDMCYWFEVACSWCVGEYIVIIWKMLSEYDKASICKKKCGDPLVAYWVGYITGRWDKLRLALEDTPHLTLNERMTYASADSHQPQAFEFFWDKLTHAERARNAANYGHFAVKHALTEIMCVSVELLGDEERPSFYRHNAGGIVKCFLSFPYDEYFIPSLDEMAKYMRLSDYTDIFYLIRKKMTRDIEISECFVDVLQQFWVRCPTAARDAIKRSLRKTDYYLDIREVRKIKDILNIC